MLPWPLPAKTGSAVCLAIAGGHAEGSLMLLLPTLFSDLPVVTRERELSAPVLDPHPEDVRAVARAATKRQQEYLAGRHCARAALEQLGIRDFVLRADADRAPVWPAGIVGSLTHTGNTAEGFCGVVVARTESLVSLGVDAELARPLPEKLWETVLTKGERQALDGMSENARGVVATLLFSAKESVYKALFPLHRRFLDFHEVEVRVELAERRFEAHVEAPPVTTRVGGRFLLDARLVVTGVAISRARSGYAADSRLMAR